MNGYTGLDVRGYLYTVIATAAVYEQFALIALGVRGVDVQLDGVPIDNGDDAIINHFYIDFIIRMSRINSYFGGGVISAAIDVLWCAWVRRRYNQYGPILVSARCKTAVDVYRGFGSCR